MERKERITTSQGLGIRTPERGLGPLFSLVVVLLLHDNVLIGWVLLFSTTWPVSSSKIPIVVVWYFHGLGAFMNLFQLWSKLYFEMLDASLILWFETYSVTLVHLFKTAHFSPKTAFSHKVCLHTWNLWIILMYRDITFLKSLWFKTWNIAKRITCCMYMLHVTALIMHVFAKHYFFKNLEFNTYAWLLADL